MRECTAIITAAIGRGGTRQFPLKQVQAYTTSQSIDTDADAFSVDIGDPFKKLGILLDRDVEVRANIFLSDPKHKLVQIFSGIADDIQRGEDQTISIAGRDVPSSLAVDSDAIPGRWNGKSPTKIITDLAHARGITNLKIAKMSSTKTVYTDGSEKEWALWYRLARTKGMYMWSDTKGGLIIDKLGYALAPSYKFGRPNTGSTNGWIPVEHSNDAKSTTGRRRRVLVYGEVAKKGRTYVVQGVDTSIRGWKKQSTTVLSSSKAKSPAAAKIEADDEVFDSIVGAKEITLTIRDAGVLVEQNKMAQVNLPEDGISGIYFIVGVQLQGGPNGFLQIVRLREKGFALDKRVPDAPVLVKGATGIDTSSKPAGSIAAALAGLPGIRWADSFVRATNEFGVANGWDFAVFLAALLAICQKETGFLNEREGGSGFEWQPYDKFMQSTTETALTKSQATIIQDYHSRFANNPNNGLNPYHNRSEGNAGVGPMQLTGTKYKEWADSYGWNGKANKDEYQGGRWNPDSNIRAAARVLIEKLQTNPPADPTKPDQIFIGIRRYNGSAAYETAVRALYGQFLGEAQAAVVATASVPAGTQTAVAIPGHGQLQLPSNTPDEVSRIINAALRLNGDPYEYQGAGPHYDCSSFAGHCLAAGSARIRTVIDEPRLGHHGDTTYTYFRKGRFQEIIKDDLRPADLVFFNGSPPEHMGIYLTDGLFIHDPHAGDFVKVSSLGETWYRDNYVGARRVADWNVPVVPTSETGWLSKAGNITAGSFVVEKMAKPQGGLVDLTQPAAGIMHTTEGTTFSGALSTLNANEDWPMFLVGVEASGAIRIAQFYPAGTAARSVKHTGSPPTNGWARAQIEVVGISNLLAAWEPTNPTFNALAALLAELSKAPWSIPLSRPGGWADTYNIGRRLSGVWGTDPGWFGHVEIPENDHLDPGQLKYSDLFTRAAAYV